MIYIEIYIWELMTICCHICIYSFSDTCWQCLPHEPEDAAVAAERYLLLLHAATASLRLSTLSLPLSVMSSVHHTLSDIILNPLLGTVLVTEIRLHSVFGQ